ncbi:Nonribosomal peptide synthetase 4 [Tolypocladium ophioglossoides CBS 100239]|uniref:Nonribosomal peptide synthetase 4 n=1 Tax=Tolypocladium ophioglossoides (strain CBS 100239) TaxID=1163406 RepID=A0A0L0NG18_TOLOC|nr:Nonribosomal peptide synthetase 4 [Tolypocladium ophioglossoides CBS 100239]
MRTISGDGDGGGGGAHTVNTATTDTKQPAEATGLTGGDLEQLWHWNEIVPPPIQTCMQDLFRDKAQQQPDAVAVQSWDGTLTYTELDELSSRLARQLRRRGVDIGTRVPLCFEKSMWAVVSLLGVIKAGATFSLTDPSQPEARLQTIVEQTGAKLVVTSVAQSELGRRICGKGQVVAVSRDYFDQAPDAPDESLPHVPASTPMYIIFTSGSTGKPKGVVISHENYTSGAIPRAEAVGYRADSRVFDFPSYAFDVSIDCMLCTLASGGRICVPSEADRMNDLSGAIRKSRANMVHMTPSVARVLDADIIPSLDVLGLGGEAVSASDAAAWSKHTNLVIAYGPSECTVGCTINNTVTVSTGIGKGIGGTTWITDPDNHNSLVPVGGVGELLVEGPVVGIGYLGEPEKTAEVFIEDPTWLTAGHGAIPGRRGRLYKTGDLVQYEANGSGSIEFVGRKDQQVKLRGQRVELTEVEYHLRSCLPSGVKVTAEVIKHEGGAATLVAFLSESPSSPATTEDDGLFTEPSSELDSALAAIDTAMGARVPRYMVPAAFVTLRTMPSLVSGKMDRKRLREIGISIPREKLAGAGSGDGQEEPETEQEKQLQRAWSKVLGQDAKAYRNSNFFALGGDSLRAMRLVAAARDEGLALTVADIFTSPTLDSMATKARIISETSHEDIALFSLLGKDWDVDAARKETATLCDIDPDVVEDIYPCTPLQEALMALSAKVKEAYVAQRVVELVDAATAERLIAPFDTAKQDCPILRTRIVQVSGRGLMQVIVRGRLHWYSGSNLDEYLVADRDEIMDLGKPLVRYAVINDGATGKVSFVLTMHHALYDGWSMPLVVDRVNKAYKNQTVTRPAEFKHFIKYLAGMDGTDSETYWRDQLRGANGPQFPSLPFQGYQTQADSLLEVYVPLKRLPAINTTVATVIRAAWAVVASQYINSEDVVFGETLTGRNAPLVGAEEIEGPMITTVPVRVLADRDTPVVEYLQAIQEQTVVQIPHEHFGLQHIRRLSPDALEACELRTGLVLHPSAEGDNGVSQDDDLPANRLVPPGDAEAAQEALKFNTYALMLVCSIDPRGFLVMASFDSRTVASPMMQRVLDQFRGVAQALCERTTGRLGDISCLTEDDFGELRDRVAATGGDPVLGAYDGAVAAYIVDSRDANRLLPAGAVGELIVQTPSELQSSLIAEPTWLSKFQVNIAQGKLYKTGKLAKFTPDGPLQLVLARPNLQQSSITNTPQHPPTKRVSATSRRQRKLRSLWSRVLHIAEDDIGLNDSFFLLGGDSIAAMKLVSEARLEGVRLTVMHMFQKRSLYDMAAVMEEEAAGTAQETEQIPAFALLDDVPDVGGFVETVVRPQLADQGWKVANVLPTRPLQQVAVRGTTQMPRFSARYELMYFDAVVDKPRLAAACKALVARNEILRTVFVQHADQGYAAVVEDLRAAFVEHALDAGCSVAAFARKLCELDILTSMPPGSAFVKWFLVEAGGGQQSCLIFRLSHAQYDEICLPILLHQLSALYEGRSVPQSVPFSAYVGHVLRAGVPASVPYWRELLVGSAMTVLKPDGVLVLRSNHFAVEKTVDISLRPRDVTVATLPTAAWALCLARRLALRDVVFGEVVSGRNIDFPGADAVTGPCWQYVPVRVRFAPGWTVADLLAHVQHQHVASAAHEAVGLSEILARCVDWDPAVTPDWFDSVVHQDVAHVETLPFAAASGRMETVYPHEEPLREWKIQAFIDGDRMTLEVVTVESWGEYARGLLDELADVASFLVREPQALLFDAE